MDYAKAEAELAEAVAQIRAIQQIRKHITAIKFSMMHQ